MRIRIATVSALLLGGIAAAGGSARADDTCISPQRAAEKMQANTDNDVTYETLSESQVETLAKAFSDANGGRKMKHADQAQVFHRQIQPLIAWIILFEKGCAVGQLPMEEKTVRSALVPAAGAKSDSKNDSKPAAPAQSAPAQPGAAQ